jgi:actin
MFDMDRNRIEQCMSLRPVVLDPGSGVFKAGYAGEEYPIHCFQNVVGLPHLYDELAINERRNRFLKKLNGYSVSIEKYIVGEEALNKRHNHTLSYPMEKGMVLDWDKMEYVFEHTFLNLLNNNPEETLVLITEPVIPLKKNREKMAEFLFDVFQVPGMHSVNQAVLALYSSGRTTGLVIDSGDTLTQAVPIFDGCLLSHAVEKLELGGRDVTNNLQRLFMERGFNFNSTAEHHFVRELKESTRNIVYVNVDPNITSEDIASKCLGQVREKEFEVSYTLPDRQVITIGRERLRCTEMLFTPSLIGKESLGISALAWKSIMNCERDVKKDLYSNIVLVGGNTMFKGFKERINKDLEMYMRANTLLRTVKIHADVLRQFSAWVGGSVVASLSTFQDLIVTIEEWDDYGASILERKFDRM